MGYTKLHIGCSGWDYRHWQGLFYPLNLPQAQWLQYYMNRFNTVELNSTFYQFPKATTVHRWYSQAPDGFLYSLKVNRLITHIKRMRNTKELLEDFYVLGNILEEKMGCFLFQFPPTFQYTIENLERLLDQLNPQYRNVVEFRHDSWWNEDVYQALQGKGIAFCSISYPDLPEDFIDTSGYIYLRVHGRMPKYGENYEESELTQWANKLINMNLKNIWIYFNNDYHAFAPSNALLMYRVFKNPY